MIPTTIPHRGRSPHSTTAPSSPLLPGLLVLCGVFVVYAALGVRADLLAASRVEMCTQEDRTALNCERKMVVTLSLNGGEQGGDQIEAVVDRVTDPNGVEQRLQDPWRISLSKSIPTLRYPLTYRQRVNDAPREEIVYKGYFFDTCADGAFDPAPTCGWAVKDGQTIAYSQGFCCECSLGDVVGGGPDQLSRAGLNCELFGDGSSAHCLRMGDLWLDLFSVGSSTVLYNVDIDILRVSSSNTNYAQSSLRLSPEKPNAATQDGLLIAKLVGDFSPWMQYAVLQEKMLCVPAIPTQNARVQQGINAWMLLDKENFALDGTVCNKIGVSYAAFQNSQPNRCTVLPKSCLLNQPVDFYNKDINREQLGERPEYLLRGLGEFEQVVDSTNQRYLSLTLDQIQTSVVTLEVSADSIRYITNVSPGRIIEAYVDQFEAQSRNGMLRVHVTNVGGITAEFLLTVTECSPNIHPVLAKSLSLAGAAKLWTVFNIYSETQLETNNVCTVSLYNAVGELQQAVLVNFTSSATEHTNGAQDGSTNSLEGANTASDGSHSITLNSCEQMCTGLFDLGCFLTYACWGELVLLLLIVAGSVIALVVFFKYLLPRLLKRFCCKRSKPRRRQRTAGAASFHPGAANHQAPRLAQPYQPVLQQSPPASSAQCYYLNVSAQDAEELADQFFVSVGSQGLSVLGTLISLPSNCYHFHNQQIMQTVAFDHNTQTYVEVAAPAPLPSVLCSSTWTDTQARKIFSVEPRFICINAM